MILSNFSVIKICNFHNDFSHSKKYSHLCLILYLSSVFFFLKRAFYFQLEKREHVWYTGPEEDTSVFILEKKLSDSLYYDSVDEVSTLLCNDRRGGQEGSCQRNLRTWADSYLIIEELEDISHGRAGCLDQLVSSWASKKAFLFDNWFKPFVPISISWKP